MFIYTVQKSSMCTVQKPRYAECSEIQTRQTCTLLGTYIHAKHTIQKYTMYTVQNLLWILFRTLLYTPFRIPLCTFKNLLNTVLNSPLLKRILSSCTRFLSPATYNIEKFTKTLHRSIKRCTLLRSLKCTFFRSQRRYAHVQKSTVHTVKNSIMRTTKIFTIHTVLKLAT
jgi:hypothetical protein